MTKQQEIKLEAYLDELEKQKIRTGFEKMAESLDKQIQDLKKVGDPHGRQK